MSNEPTIINAAGVEMPVTNVVFHENYVIAYTDAISVRFEKVGDELQNGDFKITGDLSIFLPAPEVAIEDETADVTIDTKDEVAVANDATIGVDPATEGGDTTVTETVENDAATPSIPEGSIAKAEGAVTTE